jgi:ABC-type transport system involved in multi-copper enzyme maturation permease subunit
MEALLVEKKKEGERQETRPPGRSSILLLPRRRIVSVIFRYEIKRALARKKILALVILTIALSTLPYYLLYFSSTTVAIVPVDLYPYLWLAGVFVPETLFIQLVAILVAASAMSEEHEARTAELFLAKPVRKSEYFLGKFLGGYTIVAGVLALSAALSVTSATSTFGPQQGLYLIPSVLVLEIYSSLVFYSFAFMVGEVTRRTSLTYLISASIFAACQIVGTYIIQVFVLTGNGALNLVYTYLPSTSSSFLALRYALPRLPEGVSLVLSYDGLTNVVTQTDFALSIILTMVYTSFFLMVALTYFRRADVATRGA